MKDQVLSIDQMKHLASLGVDISKASMCWIKSPDGKYELSVHDEWCYESVSLDPVPAFTLQDIIDLLPPISHINIAYFLSIRKNNSGYRVAYHTSGQGNIIKAMSEDIVDSAYEVLLWVIENKHINR